MSIIGKITDRLAGVKGELLITFILRIAAAGTSFGFNWLIAQHFGPRGTGLFAAAITTTIMLSAISLLGLDAIIVRTIARARVENDQERIKAAILQVLKGAMMIAIPSAAILLLAYDPISRLWVASGAAGPFFAIAGLTVPLLALTRLASVSLRALGRVPVSQLVEGPLGTGLAGLALGGCILAGYAGDPVIAPILYTSGLAIACAYAWFRLWRIVGSWPVGERTPMRKAGLAMFGAQISIYFVEWFTTLILSFSMGAAEAGIFRVVFQIGTLFTMVMMAGETVTGPHIAAAFGRHDLARVSSLARNVSLVLTLASLPLLLVVLVFPEFVLGLFGPEFTVGANALRIVAIGHIANISTGPVSNILLMSGRERYTLFYGIGGTVVASIFALILIPRFGLTGAGAAVASGILVRRIAATVIVRQQVGIRFFGPPKPPAGT